MKQCTTCREYKEKAVFNKNKRYKDGLQTICRDCSNARSRQYYAENKEKHVKEVSKRKEKVIRKNRAYAYLHLLFNHCVDCGEDDPLVLEFDHVRRAKRNNVSHIIHDGYSLKSLKEEIAKCDVRCANCHRRRTIKTLNWWMNDYT